MDEKMKTTISFSLYLHILTILSFCIYLQKFTSGLFPLLEIHLVGLGQKRLKKFSSVISGGMRGWCHVWFCQFVGWTWRSLKSIMLRTYFGQKRSHFCQLKQKGTDTLWRSIEWCWNRHDCNDDWNRQRWKYFEFLEPIHSPREMKQCPQCLQNLSFSSDTRFLLE